MAINQYDEDEPGVITGRCLPGDKIKICHSPFYNKPADDLENEMNGFSLQDDTLGRLEIDGENVDCVYYYHDKSGIQVIKFREGRSSVMGSLTLEGIAVHDHATVTAGGPAYATYYSGPQEEGE